MPLFTHPKMSAPIFYAHVPKTGGTYIEDIFMENGYRRHLWNGRPKRTGFTVSPQHFHSEIYMQIVNLDVLKWSFITIRHPLDRLFSEFRAHPIPGYKSFMEWVEFSSSKIASNASFRDNHFRPQVDFMHDGIEIVKTDTHLTRDWAKSISRKHNLNFTQFSVKKKRNTGVKKSFHPTSEELDMAIEFCSKYYKSDFEAFGYKMDDADIIRSSLSSKKVLASNR